MKRKANILTCDKCGKKATDNGELMIGGSPFDGWFHISKVVGGTSLRALELARNSDWYFCSLECLINKLKSK